MPPAARTPVLGVSTPTFIGAFWAIAGIGKAAAPVAAAVVAMNFRRLSLKAISSSLWVRLARRVFACRRLMRRSASGPPSRRVRAVVALMAITICYFVDHKRIFGRSRRSGRDLPGTARRRKSHTMLAHMLIRTGLAVLCAGLGGAHIQAQTTDPAESAIRAAIMKWTADVNARNSGEICNLFAPDLRYD